MTSTEKRWLELQFYHLITTIFHINNDPQDVLNYFEFAGTLYHYNILRAQNLTKKLNTKMYAEYDKKELAILGILNNIPMKKIAEYTGYNRKYLFEIVKIAKSGKYICRFSGWLDDEYALMQKIINSAEQMKGWTI